MLVGVEFAGVEEPSYDWEVVVGGRPVDWEAVVGVLTESEFGVCLDWMSTVYILRTGRRGRKKYIEQRFDDLNWGMSVGLENRRVEGHTFALASSFVDLKVWV